MAMSAMEAAVFDFAEIRAGRHAERLLGDWRGTLVCDDYSGYKELFRQGVTEAGCIAHARRKFHGLYANHNSQIAEEALKLLGAPDELERQVQEFYTMARRGLRQRLARPAAERYTRSRWRNASAYRRVVARQGQSTIA